jgi:hypothetical protein
MSSREIRLNQSYLEVTSLWPDQADGFIGLSRDAIAASVARKL